MTTSDERAQFQVLIVRLGTDEAQRVLDELAARTTKARDLECSLCYRPATRKVSGVGPMCRVCIRDAGIRLHNTEKLTNNVTEI